MSVVTLRLALQEATQVLSTTDLESPRLDAELLLCQVLNKPRSYLFTWPNQILSATQQQHFQALIHQRLQGTPIAYLLGKRAFWTLELTVTPDTLIPRPETELLIEHALTLIPSDQAYYVLDLGTGSGAIALAIASERPLAHITALDKSAAALKVAQANAQHYGFTNIQFLQSDWFDRLSPTQTHFFNMIIANPPYIAEQDPHLQQGDVRFEPLSALASGKQGLDDLTLIIQQAPHYLAASGWLVVEHGYDQKIAVTSLFTTAGFTGMQTLVDLGGNDRTTIGHYP